MAALLSNDIIFTIDSSTSSGDSAAVHALSSIQVGDEVYTDLVGPDSVSFNIEDVKFQDHEAKLFVGGKPISKLWPKDGLRNDAFEDQALKTAFQSNDLNAYVDSYRVSATAAQQGYTLSYDTPITVAEGGFIFITEKDGNNTQKLEFLDENGTVLATVVAVSKNDSDGTYMDLGVRTWAGQNIHASVFRLTDIEGLEEGAEVHSVRVILDVDEKLGKYGKYGDAGDGKVFFFGNQEVMQPNNPPNAVNDDFTGLFNEIIEGEVLGNDSDPDGDPLTVISNTQPANGTVTMNPDGTFIYSPIEGFSGKDMFNYTISDGNGGTDTATVTLTVASEPCEPGNRPPVAVKDIFVTEFDTSFTGNVLDNDSDPDGDTLSVLTNTKPANGTVTMNPDGTFTYTPKPGFVGEDSFSYTVIDGNGGYDQTTVHITVPCFAEGTLIVTAEGPKPVEDIRIGDKVLTRDDGFQPVRWTGRRVLDARNLAQNPDFTAVLISAGALGNTLPRRDLRVSPGHRILLSGYKAEMLFGEREVLVAASDLLGQPGITQDASPVTYVHIMFDSHQIIDSEGAWSESFQPADVTLNGLDRPQRDELLALFPELATRKGQRSYATARRVLARHESSALLAM